MKNLLRNALIMCALVAGTASTIEARPHRHRGHRVPRVQVMARPQYFRPAPCFMPVRYVAPASYIVPVQRVRVVRPCVPQPRFGFNIGFGF